MVLSKYKHGMKKNKENMTMKKFITDIRTLGALLITAATITACSSDSDIEEKQQPVTPTQKSYTLTINAAKNDGTTTRALDLDDNEITARWATTENIYVKKGSAWADGSLQPKDAAIISELTGNLTNITIAENDELELQFPKSGDITYAGQHGTLSDIATNFDWATANFTVGSISPAGVITPEGEGDVIIPFTNHQAIIKFTLKDKGNSDAAINPSAFTINDGTSTVSLNDIPSSTYTTNGDGVLYVAFPATGETQTISLTATVGTDNYTFTKSNVTFSNGSYYAITVKMKKPVCTYTAPTLRTGLTFNGNKNNVAGSAQDLVNAGTVEHGTIYYSTDGGTNWSTETPTQTNAGTYTVHYKVVPDDGYTGGVESTSLGSATMAKANGWVTLSPSSSSGWRTGGTTTNASSTISSHGGSLSATKSGTPYADLLTVSFSGNTMNLSGSNIYQPLEGITVTVTSAATTNYNTASANYFTYR